MRFSLSRFDVLPRSGHLSEINNFPGVDFPTPNCLLYTKFGAVPFLTNDLVIQLHNAPNLTFAALNFLRERLKVFQKFGKGLAQYSGLKNDPTESPVTRAVEKTSIQIWAVGGRLPVTMDQFADCVINAVPVAFQMPVDNETSFPDSSPPTKKRCQKSVQRTKSYAERLDVIIKCDEKLSKIPALVSVAGGNDLEQRLRGISSTDFTRASGVVIDGFFVDCIGGNRATHLETVFDVLAKMCAELQPQLPRFLTGIWQPDEVVRACLCGVDVFDGSLPFRLTRSGIAWLFTAHRDGKSPHAWIRFPLDQAVLDTAEVYRQPLQADCPCFACTRHNRGYISHLHSVNEMLAHILLMIHNSTQCYQFFADLRKAIKEDTVDSFAEMSKEHHFPEELVQIDLTSSSLQNADDC
ncbi:unnamed protein product [Mesocestoides corti]|uniref:Queuine tRNA-ribosyltransferase accessory subunit 2 n=1 Tax=Mesocestoides corti TaxID=53468 RepID=A0A0R3UIF8_MESCO|nr:unnamed protein product [Mesocestoides corti]